MLKIALIAGLVALVILCFVLRGINLREAEAWFNQTMGRIAAAGPLAFFAAMAVLPAVGAPFLGFTLTVGPAFRAQLGLGGVLAASAASLLVNITLTYWLARCWLRPWLEKLVTRYGYKVPQVSRSDQFEITLLLRITPGPPFFLQNYLLGLAKIPFPLYLAISEAVIMVHTTALVIFSDALAHGK
ncbi:MAG TPA: VTT domain-containing protein, partial [Opitutaceae bacterium]|nr:VTT domain-containing protein [Opitutaceae bacterium]